MHESVHTEEKPYSCPHCDYRAKRSYSLKLHQSIHTGEKPFACPHCDYRTTTAAILKKHQSIHTGEKPFPCPHCDHRTTTAGSLKRHQSIHTGEKPFPCPHCDYRTTTAGNLKRHQSIHTGEKPFACPHCDYRTTTAGSLKRHQSIHTGEKPFACPHCDYRTINAGKLKIHQSIHTGEKPFPCPHCDYRTTTAGNLKRHQSIHTGAKPYSCPHCDYRTITAGKLKRHQSIHTGEKPFPCPHCDYRTITAGSLKIHQSIHTGEKPYSCPHCDYRTTTAGNLKRHQSIHTGEKPFACPHCDYRTTTAGSLKIHQSIHTGEKPFPCPHCDYRTITAGSLKIHQSIHTGEKPYSCPHCDYRTTAAAYLKIHQYKHSGEKPYSCPHCDYRTTTANKLKIHQLKHTGEKPYSCPHCDYRTTTANKLKIHQLKHAGKKTYSCPNCNYRTTTASKLKIHQFIHTGEKPYTCSYCDYKTNRPTNLNQHLNTHIVERPHSCPHCDNRATSQVYHRIGSLMPSENQPSRFLQIYFMGNDDDDDIQTDRRCQQIQGVRRNIVQGLQRMLHQHNLLVQQFKTALENLPSDAYRVVVNADRTPPGQHPRRYNAPTANEVAVVLAGNQFGSRDIVLHQRDNLLQHVSDTHRFYDALQYPLIFWKGQEGYSFHIPQIDPNTRQPLSSKVSSMDFYGYFIMVRRNSPNVIVQFGQLFHQFLVDMYAKVESERLRYITLHQRNLRAESYIHLRDALSTDANINPNSLGQRIILPSSFVNSPRYLAEYTQDAFCYVRKFGRPDLFITFTNPIQDPLLYNIVVKNMIHGPCGEYNPVSPCMKNSSCSKKYPKQFLLETQTNENGYPLYRRRAPEAGGFTAKVRIRGREEVTIDNRWVVPYSPLLSKMFCAHINVENCSSVKAIKYICKYVNKGSDQAIINLRREGRGPDPQNEVRMYQCARYISSNEAVWRLLSFPLHQRHPAVIHLAVHLENGERIYFNQNTLAHRMRNPPRTTLTAFFSLCQTDSFARTLLYPDVPQYYTWNSSAHEWRRRVQGRLVEGRPGVKRSDTIGRVYAVHVSNFECFCLHMLLHNIKGPTSFAYLKIVNGSQYETFRETCAALGLLENDNHWVVTMDEAVLCQAPTRELGLGAPRRNVVTNSDILRELAYDTAELEDSVASMLPKLLPEQRRVFDAVLAKINLSQPIIIFLDAPGGTGKTFLLNLLLAMVRKEQNIAIAVASSGIAATLLADGRTAHSVLKLPLTFAEGQTAVCNIRKNSDKASLLRSCKLLVWDECTMAHKIALEALDRTLQDIRDDPQPMGGLVVLLAGDFRQTLPVVTRGTPADELNACLKSSYLWSHIVKMHLTVNMRVQLHNDTTAAQFADELLKIGEGQLETDSEGNIQFSNTFCQVVESSESLYEKVFPNIGVNYLSEEWLCAHTILAPKNSTVLEINNTILNSIPGESKIYRSIDTMVDPDESVSYPPEFLNSLELSGTPSHKIVLKVGVPVILIRNLDPPRLCNGTRLCITQMGTNVLQARILTGSFRGEEVLIPRIPIIPNDLPFKFRRLQFPVMVAFAMTINKSQGQTLQVVDKYSIANHFAHHYSSTAKLNFNLQDKIIGRKSRLTRNLAKSKPSHNIFSKPFQEHELDEALSHLDPTKAPGPDNITGPMLKNLSSHAKLELLSIFNYSWSSSTLPKEWKHATIIPIHKPGKLENHPTNYRPISLTSIPCKNMEHTILNRLTFYLNLNNLLDPHQIAFKKYQSTEDSIFYFVQQTQNSFHHKPTESTIAAFIDLSQAFDRVWKEKLILKLDELGIEGSMLSWISNFLSKRTIQVNFNNIISKTTIIYQGLPQGSILSPILFNIYLNDVHTSIKPPAKIALYADDIIIWVSKNNLSDAEQSLNKAMKNLQKVTKKLKLSINISKSEIGLFTINNHLRHWTPNIFLNNSKLQYSDSPRYLGLNWGANANILRTTYLALIRPILEYATPAWINASKTNLSKIDRIQASAAKIISGLRGSCPNRIAELESNLLPLHLRRKICFSKFITKKINSPKEHLTGKFIRNWVPNQRLKRPTPLNMAHNSNLLDIPINPKHRTSYPPHKTRNKLICFPHLPDNPHKHETQPELLKALGLQIIEENSSLFDITIYTDGSQLETGLSGSGIAIYKDKILEKICLSHPRHLSVYKSELSAIDTALKDININSPSKIIIYSDSRAAIYTLQSCFSSQEPLLKSIAKSVNRLPANSSVTVQWLPAHVGIPGNELADSLAKAGALGLPEARESTTQLDERDLLRTIKTQCLQEWKSDAAHDWYRAGGTSTGSVLPREQQSLISRLKSGHLRTMTFQNGCKVFPLCTKCNSQPATPRHIIDCIDSSIDELYSSPADTIKNLKLYRLDTLV
ncbi:hypothetical protein LAZ67_17003027 [Cordylochernes scorpioides]|uniref:ATP-dependent DNA helicase n=1 Tax=Cordylochernes scorpioides TaxID=51811 RepID=A0ABY6LJ78_9ARAC|nr:hypothetical protein LAZ67_17003027 [Cordylochernes scorpioides]